VGARASTGRGGETETAKGKQYRRDEKRYLGAGEDRRNRRLAKCRNWGLSPLDLPATVRPRKAAGFTFQPLSKSQERYENTEKIGGGK